MFQNITAGVYVKDSVKIKAEEKRDEIWKKLQKKVYSPIENVCANYFKKEVDSLIYGTNQEVKKFLKNLGGAVFCVLATAGTTAAAVITPPAILISPAAGVAGGAFIASLAHTIKTGIGVTEKLKQESPEGELDLEDSTNRELKLQLYFGVVSIQLQSKI